MSLELFNDLTRKKEKFIPIIFERDEKGNKYVPNYLLSIYPFDLSNETYETEFKKLVSYLRTNSKSFKPEFESGQEPSNKIDCQENNINKQMSMQSNSSQSIDSSFEQQMQAPMKSFTAALAMVGGWDEKNGNDVALLSHITELPYDKSFRTQLLSLINDYPILEQNNQAYRIKDRITVWKILGKWIDIASLNIFAATINQLANESDSEFGSISDFLKGYLLETLVLLGVYGNSLIHCSPTEISKLIKRCICCFYNKNGQDWKTFLRYSDEFAEADPDTYLDIIQDGIKGGSFNDLCKEDYLYSSTVASLIISLERLMFIPECRLRVCDILAQLSELDQGGNWYPRAINQLAHIFMNGSSVQMNLKTRKDLLQIIKNDYPQLFWKMIEYILPNIISDSFHRPLWRVPIPEDDATNEEGSTDIEQIYYDMFVEMLELDISKVKILTKNLPILSEKVENKFLDFLRSDLFKNQPDEVREPVWESLFFHTLLYTEESYSGRVQKWKSILQVIAPVCPHVKYRYLYNQDKISLLSDQVPMDEIVEKMQIQALEDILKEEGLDGLWEFVTHIQLYWFASSLICETDKVEIVEKDIFARKTFVSDEEKVRRFSASFLFCRANRNGLDWIDEHFDSSWDENTRLNYLLPLPFNNDTWDRVSQWLQNPEKYWEQVIIPMVDITQKNPNTVIQELIKCNRVHEAVIYTACNLEGDQKIDISVCTTLLETFLNSSNEVKDSYHVQKIISYLRKKNICHEQILALEMKLLQKKGLSYPVRPMEIWKELRSSPEYFCYFIKLVQDSNLPFMVTCQMEKSLKQWNLLPGKNEDGFNFDEFKSWFEKVKAISKGTSYELKAMEVIGRHLAEIKPPESEDSFWLLPEIAELLNRKENEALLSGLKLYLYDPKEVHCINEEYIQKSQQDLDKKAEQAEKLGYLRIADAVRDVRRKYLD